MKNQTQILMQKKNLYLFPILLFSMFCIFSTDILACSYFGNPRPSLSYNFSKTESVFIGKAKEISVKIEENEEGDKFNVQSVQIEVEKVFKGNVEKTTEIVLAELVERTSCDREMKRLEKDKSYIIFFKNQSEYIFSYVQVYDYDSKDGDDKDLVSKLESFSKSTDTVIQGHIDNTQDAFFTRPFKNLDIIIDGNGIRLKGKTDKDGYYFFSVPFGGKYKVRIFTPYEIKDYMNSPNKMSVFDSKSDKFVFEYEIQVERGSQEYNYFVFLSTETEKNLK